METIATSNNDALDITPPSKDLLEAIELGKHILTSMKTPPHFLPNSRALLFFTTNKIGCGLGAGHGHGFIISRLADLSQWSAPIFVTIDAVDAALFGFGTVSSLLGIVSERALNHLLDGHLIFGAEYSFSSNILGKEGTPTKHHEVYFNSEYSCASINEHGMMIDIGFSGIKVHVDNTKNQHVYGDDVTVDKILRGEVATPPKEMDELSTMLVNVTHAAFVYCFEISNDED